jgi:sulfate/thiosulfate transport system substrate-binding protein
MTNLPNLSIGRRSPWQQRWQFKFRSLRSLGALFLVGLSISGAIAACSPQNTTGSAGSPSDLELTLVSFAVTKDGYARVIPKFTEKWKQEHNQNLIFNQSYGGSGSQTRAVVDGLEADIVHLALALDTDKIVKAGLIEPGWEDKAPNKGIVTKSVAALVTREGNPKGIKTWSDLEQPGIKLITADPKTSGVARWNFLALWGSVVKTGGDAAKAKDFVSKVYGNVPILTKDAREASDVFFKQGQGDALINYENEILLAADKGEKLPYTIPEVNISIDNPIAIVDKNVDKHKTREVSEAFVKYLFTPEAQREFAQAGFRPVDPTIAKEPEFTKKFPAVKTLFTAEQLGGWTDIQKQFFADGALFDQIQSSIKKA